MNTCKQCGKELPPAKPGPRRVFCSIKCKSAFSGTRHKYTNTCQECGKEFHPHRAKQKFCSRKCGVRGRAGKTQRSTSQLYNCQCKECGAALYRKPYLLKTRSFFFCDKTCAAAYKRRAYRGSGNGNFRDLPLKTCEGCGKVFSSYQKSRRFCGIKCSAGAQSNAGMAAAFIGQDYELKCKAIFEELGFTVVRSHQSRGPFDLVCLSKTCSILVQVKYTKSWGRRSTKETRRKLYDAAWPPGARKQIWCYVLKRGWFITELHRDGKISTIADCQNTEDIKGQWADLSNS